VAMRDGPWNRHRPLAQTDLLERLAARHGWVADGVLIGNGSNELIQATLAVTVGAGTPVVTPVPTFSLYRLLAAVLGGRHVPVPLTADFQFDLDALVGAARAARAPLIVINSPNNPTGTPLPEGAVARLLAETGALILLDEAYQDFGGPTAVPLLRDQPRLIVLRTFSKAMSRADSRGSRVCAPFPRPPTLCSSAARRGRRRTCSTGWCVSTGYWCATCRGHPGWMVAYGSPPARTRM